MADIPRIAGAFAVGLLAMTAGAVGALIGAVWLLEVGPTFGLELGLVHAGMALAWMAIWYPANRVGDRVQSHVREHGLELPRPGIRAEMTAKQTAGAAASIVGTYGLVGLVERHGIGGILYALSLEVIAFIQGIGDTWAKPLFAFANGLANVVSAVFPARIINAAADFTAFSITQGDWNFFGPLTFAVGVIATMLGLGVFMLALRRIDFSATRALFTRR